MSVSIIVLSCPAGGFTDTSLSPLFSLLTVHFLQPKEIKPASEPPGQGLEVGDSRGEGQVGSQGEDAPT